ncbi:hypothetical protein BHE74_00045840 [Ensete ventricosum]|nr:hypothetical protein BHE74_00045840 [Ensete ventricosum]
MGEAATSRHGSRMPRWLESSVKNRGKQRRVRSSAVLVWASTSGGRRRWTSVHDRSMKEEQHIWFWIARLEAQAAAEAGLSWPRLPPRRIRRCGVYCSFCPQPEMVKICCHLTVRRELALGKWLEAARGELGRWTTVATTHSSFGAKGRRNIKYDRVDPRQEGDDNDDDVVASSSSRMGMMARKKRAGRGGSLYCVVREMAGNGILIFVDRPP